MIECKQIANLALAGVKGYNEMNGRIYDESGASPALRANSGGHNEIKIAATEQKDNVVGEPSRRIRKLTPRECWRLMDFDDEDFDRAAAVNSKTQLYKQVGNSIVVNCLVAIFGQMIEGKENVYKERKEPKP